MITVIYSTHKDKEYNEGFKDHLKSTSGLRDIEIIEFENFGQYSLSNRYNKGIEMSNNDIVVCCHNDIKLSKNWGKKLLQDFNDNPEYSIIGKAGTCYFSESGIYWERMNHSMVGQVYHHPPGDKKWLSKYSVKTPFLIDVISIDGLFISFNKSKIKHRFDESYGKFHFYDHGFCLPNYLDGIKIGVTSSFTITHESIGRPSQEFSESKELFVKKYSSVLPLELKPTKINVPTLKEKPIKCDGKVAIIIPTKGKVNMLLECVKSYYDNSNPNLFDVFIADTGSTDEEKEWIKDNILPMGNITLIEYDYYNFGKINNDVVRNHLNDNHKYLLFSNNDVKVLNNVIYRMLKTYKSNKKIGTIGCRLHYEDKTIQHNGILLYMTDNRRLNVTHLNLKGFYNYNDNNVEVVGNTAGLMMVKKHLFDSIGGFNENYLTCFEDVEFNIECIKKGYINYCDGEIVAYHYESQTRKDENILKLLNIDYKDRLLPFITKNLKYIYKYIIKLK